MKKHTKKESLEDFKNMKADYLLSTDVASRGIDIIGVQTVINIEFPANIKTYIHRVGRTARAGEKGHAVSLVAENRKKLLKQLINSAQKRGEILKSREINQQFMEWCYNEIQDMMQETKVLLNEESNEREMRIAHLKINKSINIVKYANSIYNNPKKTWFQTKQQKINAKKQALMQDVS